MTAGVAVDLKSVRRSLRESGGGQFWVELRTPTPSDGTFFEAIGDMNDSVVDGTDVFAEFPTRSPNGYVTQLGGVPDDEHLQAWLAEFANRLEQLGFTGTLRGIRPTYGPAWIEPRNPPEPTAMIAWSIDLAAMTADPQRTSHWHVPAEATRRICDHLAAWTEPGGPDIVLRRNTCNFKVSDGSTVADVLASAALATGMAGVVRGHDRDAHGRVANLAPGGETTMQIDGGPLTWADRIDSLRAAITAMPDITNQAFIRPLRRPALFWDDIGGLLGLPYGLRERHLRYNKHLLDRYVPDAHGIQVLRDEHLDNAHDLSNWTITDLGHGRHLVEALDLAPWYANPLPDDDTVAQARHDFGAMILTEETISANPPPWKELGPSEN